MSVHFNCLQMFPCNVCVFVSVSHFEGLNRKNAKLRHVKMLPQTSYKILTYLQWWWFENGFDWNGFSCKLSLCASDLQSFRIYTVLIRVVMERQNNGNGKANALKTFKVIIFEIEKGKRRENSSHSFSWASRFDYILFFFGFYFLPSKRFCSIPFEIS